jgi:hypothetical protein
MAQRESTRGCGKRLRILISTIPSAWNKRHHIATGVPRLAAGWLPKRFIAAQIATAKSGPIPEAGITTIGSDTLVAYHNGRTMGAAAASQAIAFPPKHPVTGRTMTTAQARSSDIGTGTSMHTVTVIRVIIVAFKPTVMNQMATKSTSVTKRGVVGEDLPPRPSIVAPVPPGS